MIPDRVPTRVRLLWRVCGDFPFLATSAEPGEYPCEANRYGAVSVRATNGKMLGLRPGEFEPLEWAPNPWAELEREVSTMDPESYRRAYLGEWDYSCDASVRTGHLGPGVE